MASTSYLKLPSLFAEQGSPAIGLSMELHGAHFARTLSVIKITDDLIIKQEIETSKLKNSLGYGDNAKYVSSTLGCEKQGSRVERLRDLESN